MQNFSGGGGGNLKTSGILGIHAWTIMHIIWGGGACDAWLCHAFARGFGGMLPRKKNFNGAIWCVLEHIFIIFLLSKSLKISFLYKNNYKL